MQKILAKILCFTVTPLLFSAVAHGNSVVITQAKALQGNITPGDAPGFPITISVSGVYKFAGNIAPGVADEAILIKSRMVTIDLNGFNINGALKTNRGIISAHPHFDYVTIENGRVIDTVSDGIWGDEHWTVRNVNVVGFSHGTGIILAAFARVENSTVDYSNPGGYQGGQEVAIDCADVCHIESSSISGGIGILINQGSIINNTLDGTRTDNPNLQNWAIFNRGDQTDVGFANNMVFGKVSGAIPMQPNVCTPACPSP